MTNHYNIGLKQQEFTLSVLGKPEIHNQGVNRATLPLQKLFFVSSFLKKYILFIYF